MINVITMQSPITGEKMRVPVLVETVIDRRRDADAADVADLSMLVMWGCGVLLGLAALHIISNPLPVAGGRAAGIDVAWWFAWAIVTALCKLYGRLKRDKGWRSIGAKSGFLMWVALSISVYLPGIPVMSWIFMPILAAAEAILFLRLSTAHDLPSGN